MNDDLQTGTKVRLCLNRFHFGLMSIMMRQIVLFDVDLILKFAQLGGEIEFQIAMT